MKNINKASILRSLIKSSPLTKAEIASRTQLTFVTVSNLLTELVEEGLVQELGYAESNGGRKPVLFGINSSAYVFLGVDVQVEKLVCVLTDFQCKVLDSRTELINVRQGPDSVIRQIRILVDRILNENNVEFKRIGGIGASTPGPIDDKTGVIISPPNMPGWKNVPFRDMLQHEFQVACHLEKDANAAALGESRFGTGAGIQHLIYIIIDVGIGGGIIINGEVYRGFLNGAGEIGHISIDVNGTECNCGTWGCLEAMASRAVIEKKIAQEFGYPVPFDKILELSAQGDNTVNEHLAQAGSYLGVAIANLCNIFNPEMVILGGDIATRCDVYFEHARQTAKRRILPDFSHRIKIERAKLGELSGAIGAAVFAFEKMFHDITSL
ncbi:ROK family transcriptional regulator [Polycladomyces subterraneus]|uniref:ROK family transcriptional regulator n=1 Tax=Polycladomyces subterraneus TaxID=1016997 RepID=A0ABT8IJS8_9BACL|nr:ROK family transcriptional regulator [Polycladomyces subterraneus]MDN4593046.1 ROK family transcriptional regulator [Polycladomyces subterraneus]